MSSNAMLSQLSTMDSRVTLTQRVQYVDYHPTTLTPPPSPLLHGVLHVHVYMYVHLHVHTCTCTCTWVRYLWWYIHVHVYTFVIIHGFSLYVSQFEFTYFSGLHVCILHNGYGDFIIFIHVYMDIKAYFNFCCVLLIYHVHVLHVHVHVQYIQYMYLHCSAIK